MVIAIGLLPSAAGELKSMNREFEGIYQVAKQRYNLYYTTTYKEYTMKHEEKKNS